jgi:hypothetical protein
MGFVFLPDNKFPANENKRKQLSGVELKNRRISHLI